MPTSPTPFLIEEYVRWSDVDYAGIIFYGAYVRFFEIAETELFRASGLAYKEVFDRHGIFLPRRAIHAEFFVPAKLDDRLTVAAYIGKVGTRSMTINFDVVWGAPRFLGATGWQVLVCVDRQTLKPRALPEAMLQALAPHTLPPEAARAALGVRAP
ncbi:MAG TPA: thioesterase family protein [Gemmatimonadales bacterium]|jgi:YbgC/YbaW family acyl-CoA thioester hydrolase|nr:thioesterase family protein [Gemmatimonadales bacterium]